MLLSELVDMKSGSAQFRIKETTQENAPTYIIYNQNHLMSDLQGVDNALEDEVPKIIRTTEPVATVQEGDIIFNLMSGTASCVSSRYAGYLYTHNFVRLEIIGELDPWYLIFLLNESRTIHRQLQLGVQGSSVLKYTLVQLRKLHLPTLPPIEQQSLIGDTYAKVIRRKNLIQQVTQLEEKLVLQQLKGLEA